MICPSTSRAISLSSAALKSVVPVISNGGESPSTVRSERSVSPSCSKASSRIVSARSVRLRSLATVKSQAR